MQPMYVQDWCGNKAKVREGAAGSGLGPGAGCQQALGHTLDQLPIVFLIWRASKRMHAAQSDTLVSLTEQTGCWKIEC